MTSGHIFGHSLRALGVPLCILRLFELGFGLSARLRMIGHDCTYSAFQPALKKRTATRWAIFERHRHAGKERIRFTGQALSSFGGCSRFFFRLFSLDSRCPPSDVMIL